MPDYEAVSDLGKIRSRVRAMLEKGVSCMQAAAPELLAFVVNVQVTGGCAVLSRVGHGGGWVAGARVLGAVRIRERVKMKQWRRWRGAASGGVLSVFERNTGE